MQQLSMKNTGRRRWLLISLLVVIATLVGRDVARAQINETGDLSIELVDPKVLRVCADPRNLPFSNEKGEGFENKLAELFAEKLQKKLEKEPNSLIFTQLAEEYRKEGLLQEALRVCQDGLRRHPNYWSARVVLGRIHH